MKAWTANDLLPVDFERYAKSIAISENMEHQAFLAAIRAEIATFLEAFPEILFAVLYGSAVEGMAFRDLDIAVWLDRSQIPAEGDLEFEFRIESELRKRLSLSAKYLFVTAIEAAIDLCNHLISKRGGRPPSPFDRLRATPPTPRPRGDGRRKCLAGLDTG